MAEHELANKLEKYYLRLSKQDLSYEANLRLVRAWQMLLESDTPTDGELDALLESLESDDIVDGSAFYELETSLRKWCRTKR